MRFVTKLLAALVLVMASGYGPRSHQLRLPHYRAMQGNRDRRQLILRAQSILQSAKAWQGCPQTTRSTRLRDALRSLPVVRLLFGPRELKLAERFGSRVLKATLPEAQAAALLPHRRLAAPQLSPTPLFLSTIAVPRPGVPAEAVQLR